MSQSTGTTRRRTQDLWSSRAAIRSGEAIVRLRDGRVYVGWAAYDGRAVTMPAARLRHRDAWGERRYPARARTWPVGATDRIEWTSAEGVVE